MNPKFVFIRICYENIIKKPPLQGKMQRVKVRITIHIYNFGFLDAQRIQIS